MESDGETEGGADKSEPEEGNGNRNDAQVGLVTYYLDVS